MASVSFDPTLVRPLPLELRGSRCSSCDKPQSVWCLTHADPENAFVCSLCFLYVSRWSEGQRENIDSLILAVEAQRGVPMERDATGNLLRIEDANRVFTGVVVENKLYLARTAKGKPNEQT